MDWKIFYSIFLRNREIFFKYIGLDETIFRNAILINLFIIIRKFVDKYKKQPDFDTLLLLLDNLPETEQENRREYVKTIKEISTINVEIDLDVFSDQMDKAIHDYELEKFILRTANKAGKINFDDVLVDIRSILTKFQPKNTGIDVTDVPRAVKQIRFDASVEKITTGIEGLDKVLYGGLGIEELAIIMAPPGRGKSMTLINIMYGSMVARKNVLYITLEMSEKAVLKRFYSRIAYASRKDMIDEDFIMKSAKKFFTISGATGRIAYFPSRTFSVTELEHLLETYSLYYDFNPDLIIVDYLDLLSPRKSDYRQDLRSQLRNTTDDLRSIALRKRIPVLSATQANRASLSKTKLTQANISESFGKVEIADVICALCQTDEEKSGNRMRLTLVKNRDYVSGSTIEVYFDPERMLLMDIERAHQLGILQKPKEEKSVDGSVKKFF